MASRSPGPSLPELERVASEIEAVVKQVPGTSSVFAERVMGGNYIRVQLDRHAIARYGLRVADVQDVLQVALGGMPLTTTVEGLERYSVTLRYSRDFRENLEALREIIVPTPTGAQVPLGQLAKIETVRAPMGIKSEAAVPNAWIYVDVKGVDIGTYVQMARRAVNEAVAKGTIQLPDGCNIFWSGQYEYMLRAQQRLMFVVPLTLLIIILIIYLNTRSLVATAIVMLSVPLALVGAFWMLYFYGYNLSVAVWVGLIALAGVNAETGVVMLLYLDLAYEQWRREGRLNSLQRFARRDLSRRGQARPPQGHDGLGHHRGPAADTLEPRRRRGCDETHRHADGRRRGDLDRDGTGGLSCDFLPVARAATEFPIRCFQTGKSQIVNGKWRAWRESNARQPA